MTNSKNKTEGCIHLFRGSHAWEEIVCNHQRYIFNLAYSLCYSLTEADDLTQDTFLKAFEHLSAFRGDASLRTWLSQITINTYLSQERKKQKHESLILGIIPVPDIGTDPERIVIHRELQWCIHHILQHHVPENYKVILILRDINQFSYAEISQILGISLSSVKSRLLRARRAYRNHLLKSGCAGVVREYTCYCEGVREI